MNTAFTSPSAIQLLVALLPILLVVTLMLSGWGGRRAGVAGWLMALAGAWLSFGAGFDLLFWSQVKGLALAVWVLYIVWSAMLLAGLARESGNFEVIAAAVGRLTAHRELQLLLLAWVFSAFLQGVTGFGVPVAVVAPLLVGLGFSATTAVVATSIGHAWAVTFGSVASSMYALLAVTGMTAAQLAPASAIFMGGACIACGLGVAWTAGRLGSVRELLPAILTLGIAMAAAQFLLASGRAWPLASFGAAACGLALAPIVASFPRYARRRGAPLSRPSRRPGRQLGIALAPYLILGVLVMLAHWQPVSRYLNLLLVELEVPATATGLGWSNPAGRTRGISVFGHTGALIAYAALATYLINHGLGLNRQGSARRVLRETASAAAKPTVSIVVLVGMAQAMNDSGMTVMLASALGTVAGQGYPLAAPVIGALGAFITGSNTNSNVLFGALQQQTAEILSQSLPLTLAAQNLGGAIGSAFAPAKVIVGASLVGLSDSEGAAMRQIMNVCGGIILIAGLALWLFSAFV